MRFLVTPDFNSKITDQSSDDFSDIKKIVEFIQSNTKDVIEIGSENIETKYISADIFLIKRGAQRVYASFGNDEIGEYILLLDISLSDSTPFASSKFPSTKDPRKNQLLDPNRNMMIDPRRNMMIDPRRNMMIDPNRNMMIDPRRNMMIDPRRNMMIDPNRNMMIDPRRNMMIDPRRNMMIDPRRNRYYGGPYVYNVSLSQEGFIVRANDKVSLLFDMSAKFAKFIIIGEDKVSSVFDTYGNWIEFLIDTDNEVKLRFDTNGQWIGLIV